ncbi:coiled-coil domain-containing protein 115 isoform X2 [Corythoichthys intestinalis]|uniref:coiled-coil domain-containing protein 115 isoform X2 n=1 Tax=Corythoichthys intestinalis TaxID=161448 RepID=UPI0025A614DF|nr:coiled-coil domain-containing protein 115 isoform X2 [Corythoichthys intestinalis]
MKKWTNLINYWTKNYLLSWTSWNYWRKNELVSIHSLSRTLDHGNVEFCTDAPQHNKEYEHMKTPVEDIGPQTEGVKQRRKTRKTNIEKEAVEELSSKKMPQELPALKSEHSPQKNPLQWFGILVPQSLKQAQASFKQVIELSAEIATLQVLISNTRKELKQCFKEKDEKKADVKD